MTVQTAARRALCAAAGVLALGAAEAQAHEGPSAREPGYVEGVTVWGGRRPDLRRLPNGEPELSSAVPYGDLDLTTAEGQEALYGRIARTADRLCARLGEPDERRRNTAVLPSCQTAARDGARPEAARAAERQFEAAYWARAQSPPPYGYAPRYVYPPVVYPPYPAPYPYGPPAYCGCVR